MNNGIITGFNFEVNSIYLICKTFVIRRLLFRVEKNVISGHKRKLRRTRGHSKTAYRRLARQQRISLTQHFPPD
jgi:methylmalonyl-CoA mutase N-terminal domain/subunit